MGNIILGFLLSILFAEIKQIKPPNKLRRKIMMFNITINKCWSFVLIEENKRVNNPS